MKLGRILSSILPYRISESRYTKKRNIDVDYDNLDYQIHLPTLDEEEYIEDTLKTLARQDPVQNGDVDLVVIDSNSDDDTVEIAKQYADEVLSAPTGLLSARNYGIKTMSPDVVISADSGEYYPKGWVAEHAKGFEDDNVVATYGPIYSKEWPFSRMQKIKHSIVNIWNLPGNNSAIRVSTLNEIGNFYTDLNQQELLHVLLEEQIFKKMELAIEGDIEYRSYAGMYKSQRRKKFSAERIEKYAKQQAEDVRF